jgi:hypothetical protein
VHLAEPKMSAPAPKRRVPDPDHSIPAGDIYVLVLEWWTETWQPHCGDTWGWHWNAGARAFFRESDAEHEMARLAGNPMVRAVRLVRVDPDGRAVGPISADKHAPSSQLGDTVAPAVPREPFVELDELPE